MQRLDDGMQSPCLVAMVGLDQIDDGTRPCDLGREGEMRRDVFQIVVWFLQLGIWGNKRESRCLGSGQEGLTKLTHQKKLELQI